MTNDSETSEIDILEGEQQPEPWGAVILAGLPHLFVGLLFGWSKLLTPMINSDQKISTRFIIVLALFVVVLLIYAWQRGWPLWSSSWYIYGTWIMIIVLVQALKQLKLEDSWRYSNVMLLGWFILCILGSINLAFKSKLHALLAIAFFFPFVGLSLLEFIPNPIEGLIAIALGLLTALASGAIVRIGSFRPAIGLVLGINFVSGIALAYTSEYKMLDLPNGIPAHVASFSSFLEIFALYSIFALGIVIGPFIFYSLWNFGRRRLQI